MKPFGKKKSFLYHLNQMRPNIDYIIVLGCCSIWLQYIGTTFKNFGLKLKQTIITFGIDGVKTKKKMKLALFGGII